MARRQNRIEELRGTSNAAPTLRQLRALARLLDSSIPLPGGYRIGLDGIVGLVPGLGDAIGASLSAYIIVQSARLGASWPTLLRMTTNVLIESVVGIIPVAGDLFDFAWKANLRNVALLEQGLGQPARGSPRRRLTWAIVMLLVLLAGVIVVSIWLFLELLAAIFR